MKDMIISVLLAIVLILAYSLNTTPADLPEQPAGIGTQFPSDSGRVIPGDGTEPAQELEGATEQHTPKAAEVKITTGQEATEAQEETEPERITKDDLIAAVGAGAGLFGLGQLCLALILWLYKIWG